MDANFLLLLLLLLLFPPKHYKWEYTGLSAVNDIIALNDSRSAIALNRGRNAIVTKAYILVYGRRETSVIKPYSLLAVNCYKLLS